MATNCASPASPSAEGDAGEIGSALELIDDVLATAELADDHPGIRPHLISARVQLVAAVTLLGHTRN
jgi:hypothetical protein